MVNISRASNGEVTFDLGAGIDPIVLSDSNNIVVSSNETKNSQGTITLQYLSFMRSNPYFYYELEYNQIGTINGSAKPAIGSATTDLLSTAVFQGTPSGGTPAPVGSDGQIYSWNAQGQPVAIQNDTLKNTLDTAKITTEPSITIIDGVTGYSINDPAIEGTYVIEVGEDANRVVFNLLRGTGGTPRPDMMLQFGNGGEFGDGDIMHFTGGGIGLTGTMQIEIESAPAGDSYATNKKYVDDADALKAPKASPVFTGTVTAPTFAGALTGNASTATALQTGRTFSLTGGATGASSAFTGAANASIPVTLATPTATVRGGVLLQPAIPDIGARPLDAADLNTLLAALRSAGVLTT